jgi:chromosome partitioning protein
MAVKKVLIAVENQKGGCGKTTVAVCLAACIASLRPNMAVALADADPQASATAWILRGKGAANISVHTVAADGEGKALKSELEDIDSQIIIIDCPPALDSTALRSCLRSDLILIPTMASIIDLSATKAAIAIAQEAVEYAPGKKYLLVPNRVQNNTCGGRDLRETLKRMGPVSVATLCQRVAYSDAAIYGIGVHQYATDFPSVSAANAAEEITLLAEQVLTMLSF